MITILSSEEDLRLDKLLAERFKEQSRSYFQHLIEKHLVLVNGEPVKKRIKLKAGDEVEIEFALTDELSLEPEDIPLDILFEDEDMIAVNKPAGLVVHPAPGNWSHTFVNALLFHCNQLDHVGSPLRPGIVHRLDKDTSGLLIAAKNEKAHQKLVAAFASRKVYKEYLAICIGMPKEEVISTHIARHPHKRKEMCVTEKGGKLAITHCFPLKKIGNFSLVKLVLETGRTHQIRVHMKFKGTPILGDETYGNKQINQKEKVSRQLLHAYRLQLTHPTKETPLSLEAPLPDDFLKYLKRGGQA